MREDRRAPAREAVVLLHGLWMNRYAMHYLAHRLTSEAYGASALSYHSLRETLAEHVALLARHVAATQAERVHLVGHSMGGVVLLRYLQGAPDPRVGRVVLLGSPISGCKAAGVLGRTAPWMLGRSASAWRSFDTRLDPRFEVGAIAGTRPVGLGALFLSLPAPSDGVVCVEETRFPGLRDHVSLPVAHSAMLLSARVAQQVGAFLKKGEFLR